MEKAPHPPLMKFYLGIDIASLTFAAHLLQDGSDIGCAKELKNLDSGFSELLTWLQQRGATPAETHVVMEATGVYWEQCALSLHNSGYVVSVINPAQIKDFGRSLLRRAKTDTTDAELIARFGNQMRPAVWKVPSIDMEAFQIIMRHREATVAMLTEEKNRLHALNRRASAPKNVLKSVEKHITYLERQIKESETSFKKELQKYPEWRTSMDLMESIPGIGFVTAATILTETRGLATFVEARQLTAYAGISPAPFTSGTSVKRRSRISKIGNPRIRRAVYLAAISTIRREGSAFQACYQRLRGAGKPAKVALVAIARKLLELCFTLVKTQGQFDPEYAAKLLAGKAP